MAIALCPTNMWGPCHHCQQWIMVAIRPVAYRDGQPYPSALDINVVRPPEFAAGLPRRATSSLRLVAPPPLVRGLPELLSAGCCARALRAPSAAATSSVPALAPAPQPPPQDPLRGMLCVGSRSSSPLARLYAGPSSRSATSSLLLTDGDSLLAPLLSSEVPLSCYPVCPIPLSFSLVSGSSPTSLLL